MGFQGRQALCFALALLSKTKLGGVGMAGAETAAV